MLATIEECENNQTYIWQLNSLCYVNIFEIWSQTRFHETFSFMLECAYGFNILHFLKMQSHFSNLKYSYA